MDIVNWRIYGHDLFETLARTIPLFVIDSILQSRYGVIIEEWQKDFFYKLGILSTNPVLNDYSVVYVISLSMLGMLMTIIMLVFPARQLYLMLLSSAHIFCIFISYMKNVDYISHYMRLTSQGSSLADGFQFLNRSTLTFFFLNFCAQHFFVIISQLTFYTLSNFYKFIVYLHFTLPIILSLLALYWHYFWHLLTPITGYCAGMEVIFIFIYFLADCRRIVLQFIPPLQTALYYLHRDGILAVILTYIAAARLPDVFKAFWLIRLLKTASGFFSDSSEDETFTVIDNGLIFAVKTLICQNCDTSLAVIGMAFVFSSVVVFVVKLICNLLSLPQTNRQNNLRCTVTFIFLTLAMQTGLTGLIPNERLLRLYRNIIIIFAAVAQSVYEDVGNSLISLGQSGNRPLKKHIKMLILVTIFLIYSCLMLTFLCMMHSFSPWLLASVVFNVDIFVRIMASVIIYCLYGIELRSNDVWNNLNDYVFLVNCVRHIISFLCSLVLFFNCLYILFYESMGVIRTVLMLIHFHLNIYDQLKKGYNIFCRRRKAVKIINSLKQATEQQLITLDDKCTICREHLNHGIVTKCNHYFHKACLRNWLNELSVCPICHRDASLDVVQPAFDHEHQE